MQEAEYKVGHSDNHPTILYNNGRRIMPLRPSAPAGNRTRIISFFLIMGYRCIADAEYLGSSCHLASASQIPLDHECVGKN